MTDSVEEQGFLFNVDILVKGRSNAVALQMLLEMINNNPNIADFKIKSGMEMGELIDILLQNKRNTIVTKSSNSSRTTASTKANRNKDEEAKSGNTAASKKSAASSPSAEVKKESSSSDNAVPGPYDSIKMYIKNNQLVRLVTNRNGKHVDIPCRILNLDEAHQMINVYHVDEKQVYTFGLNEVDEFETA